MFVAQGQPESLVLRSEGSNFVIIEPFQVIEPGNPSLLSVEFGGNGRIVHDLEIRWRDLPIRPDTDVVGFIDNITFHPIPEPGHLGLLGLVAVGFLRFRRQRQ